MDSIIQGFIGAGRLIFTINPELVNIILLSIQVSGTALVIATLLGVPLGAALAWRRVPLRGLVISLLNTGMALPPVMIYGDDVSHIVTEEGIANLLLCRNEEERAQAIRGVAGYTEVGLGRDRRMVEALRQRGVIRRAEDLGIDKRRATRDLLAARSIKDLVRASGGLYEPPKRFRNW